MSKFIHRLLRHCSSECVLQGRQNLVRSQALIGPRRLSTSLASLARATPSRGPGRRLGVASANSRHGRTMNAGRPTMRKLSTMTTDWRDPRIYTETRKPVDEASTLPGILYHNEDYFKAELQHLWADCWVAAAEIADLAQPGDVIPVKVAGKSVILANDKGTIRAFHNVCSHRGAQLVSEPCTRRATILCPYHRWGYSLNGELKATPSFDADEHGRTIPEAYREKLRTSHVKNFDKKDHGLKSIRADTALGMVFVNISGEAPSLHTWLGDLRITLAEHLPALEEFGAVPTAHRKVYTPASNWKILCENYLEYYHLPAVHPALCNVSGVDEHVREQGTGMYAAFATDPLTSGGTAIDPGRLPVFNKLEGTRHATAAHHVFIFPNVFFSVYGDHYYRVIVEPKSPSASLEHATLYVSKMAAEDAQYTTVLDEMYEFWDNVNTEDIEICEKVQEGTKGGSFQGGRFSFRFEESVHRFQNMVAQFMAADSNKFDIPKAAFESK